MLIKTALSQIQAVFLLSFSFLFPSSHLVFLHFYHFFLIRESCLQLETFLVCCKMGKSEKRNERESKMNRWEEEAWCRQGSVIPGSSGFEGSGTAGQNSSSALSLQHLHGNAFALSLWSSVEMKSVARYAPKVSYK